MVNTEVSQVQRIVIMKIGKRIHDFANNIDPFPVLAAPEGAKSYSISTTLDKAYNKMRLHNHCAWFQYEVESEYG